MGRTRSLAAAAALCALGCAIDDRKLSVGDAAGPEARPGEPILILPNAGGVVTGSNAAGIKGTWYAYSDTPFCQADGLSADQCTMVFTPIVGDPVLPTDLATGRLCTSGVAAQVINNPTTMALDWANIWGAGLALDINNGQGYDAAAHMITGFSLVIDSPPPDAMVVNFPNTGDPNVGTTWAGRAQPGLNVIRWQDLRGTTPTFDETKLVGIRIHVSTNENQPTPFDYCISNFSALTD